MVTIAITAEAFAIIVSTLPDGYKLELSPDGDGGLVRTLPNGILDQLEVLRGPSETWSDVLIRVAMEGPARSALAESPIVGAALFDGSAQPLARAALGEDFGNNA